MEKKALDAVVDESKEKDQHFHVLAVDDSVVDRMLLEKLLRVSSYRVTCVESGNKALEYLGLLENASSDSSSSQSTQQEGMKVNLIMTDYCMPGMSGYDLLKRVKGSSWKDVPVVVMSSENIPSRISMCLEGGAEEFLLKPLQLSDMEKLQPHLLKSIDQSSSMDKNGNTVKNSHINSKRKAMSSAAEPTTDKRPKLKGLAVLQF